MASMPLEFPADDNDHNAEPSHSSPPDSPRRSATPTMTSEDSETVLLNSVPTAESFRPPPLTRTSTLGIKKCWICVGDSTEDDSINPPAWRSPCKCSLVAHEDCLLDWVADLENPSNRRSRPTPNQILCPQCKSEIKIARPKSYIVDAVKSADRSFGRFVIPGLGASILGTLFAGCWVHGFQSVYVIFGRADAERIFRYAEKRPGALFAYGLIPLNLIFARTRYSDFVLPSGSLFLLSTQLNDKFEIDWTLYPPLPSTVFACLPAVRSLYNWSYEKAFGKLNRKWLREIQPRRDEGFEGHEQNIANIMNEQEEAAEEGGIVLELEVNLGGEEEDLAQGQNPGNQDAGNNNGAGQNNNAAPQQGNGAHVHHILGERGDEIMEGTSSIGQSILGALMFPAVAASAGGLLSFALPTSWVTGTTLVNGRPGFLRTRWGRSVIGGALLVVLKDAIVLYCRWKLAQGHRRRKIMDFDKQTKQYKVAS